MFRLIFKVFILLGLLNLAISPLAKGGIGPNSLSFNFNCSEHPVKIVSCFIAPVKNVGFNIYVEDENDSAAAKVKATLISFYPGHTKYRINYLQVFYKRTGLHNPIPISIATHNYRI